MNTVSLIVPVYKALATLPRCVKSILEQSHSNLELILVDDGSPDACGKLCDAFALADPRVRVIHQFNHGVSAARNAGLAAAAGQWVVFVDADDQLAPCALESALAAQLANPHKLVLWYACGEPQYLPQNADGSGEVFSMEKKDELYYACCFSMPWNKLFCRELLKRHAIRFDPSYSLGEDLLFCLDYCKAFFSEGGRGYYRLARPQTFYDTSENENSLTQRFRADFCPLWIELFTRLLTDCEQFFHCPAEDMALVRCGYRNTIAAGITSLMRRSPLPLRQRRQQAKTQLGRPELVHLLIRLKADGRFSWLGIAMQYKMPRFLAWLYELKQRRPALFGKLEAIGQHFAGPIVH